MLHIWFLKLSFNLELKIMHKEFKLYRIKKLTKSTKYTVPISLDTSMSATSFVQWILLVAPSLVTLIHISFDVDIYNNMYTIYTCIYGVFFYHKLY